MVKLNLIVEGGVYANNVSADTANNVESLRQSLHDFFFRIIESEEIAITIYMGAGNHNAARQFIKSDSDVRLFVDSDLPLETKYEWFKKLINDEHPEKTVVIPSDKVPSVYFMIQEMEAWFLKQTDCLERWAEMEGYTRKDPHLSIAEHSLLRNKDIESIKKPSEKLAVILKRFFFKNKKGVRYGKLTTAPKLLDSLDISRLLPLDSELQRFYSMIRGK